VSDEQHRLADYAIVDGVAVLGINNPPVNALSHVVRIALVEGVSRALADPAAQALVLICRGRTFFAGADVKELGRPIAPPLLGDVMRAFEASSKPIVSALHGTALGGGFELALAGHFRVAVPSAVVGLPEVALGLLPGAGGTQRVPRLVGVRAAVDLIGLGRHVRAPEAVELGLIDAIVDESALEAGAVAFARDAIARNLPLRRVRDIALRSDQAHLDAMFDAFRADHPDLFVGLKAPEGALEAIRAAASLPFDEGMGREREISQRLLAGPESAAQRHLFFAERAMDKLPAGTAKVRAPASVRVEGAWRHVGALPQTADHPELVVVAEADSARRLAAVRGAVAKAVLVIGPAEGLADLRAQAPASDRVIGFNETNGVVEIAIGDDPTMQGVDADAAALAMGTARALGLPALFVTEGRGTGVVDRMLQRARGTIAALQDAGIATADLAASMADFGFVPSRFGLAGGSGTANPGVLHKILAELVGEASTLQQEGAVLRGSDIDVAMVKAGLWPLWRGGPLFLAEREGAEKIAAWRAQRAALT
jgi:3-hydroxyacyl-CoA dehydrogenase